MNEEFTVLDFAYDIIAMQNEIKYLRGKLDHYKKLYDTHCERLNSSERYTKEITGLILNAIIDPESSINKGNAAIIREQLNNKSAE